MWLANFYDEVFLLECDGANFCFIENRFAQIKTVSQFFSAEDVEKLLRTFLALFQQFPRFIFSSFLICLFILIFLVYLSIRSSSLPFKLFRSN